MLADILTVALRRRADRELLAAVLGLPQLVGGSEADTPPQLQSGVDSPGVLRPAPPRRPSLGAMAAEVTVRRRMDITG
jgi:hypothetical protein